MTAGPASAHRLDDLGLRFVLARQQGVISRRQVLDQLGVRDFDIARLIRRRDLTAVHPCVYIEHTGRLSWEQRAWAAVLACWPAALWAESAIQLSTGAQLTPVIHVAVDRDRHRASLAGVRLHRVSDLDGRVDWLRSPRGFGWRRQSSMPALADRTS